MARPYKYITAEDRFWANVRKTNGCWNWIGLRIGSKGKKTYGRFKIGTRGVPVHRFSYQLHKGAIPAGKQVCHHCDNPSCVKPDHLFAGTQKDNMQDCVQKGRAAKPKAILTVRQVRAIRTRFKPWSRTDGCVAIAKEYGMSRAGIEGVVNYRRWKEVV